jgi:nitrite reductase (NADH) small subunit
MTKSTMTETSMELRVATVEDIPPGEGRAFGVMGEKLAVFRTREGCVLAVQAECPHRGGPLADGLTGGTTLVCPLHGWKFDLSTGAALMGECGLKTYPVRVDEDGGIVISFEGP